MVLRSRSTATHEIERKLQEQDERLDRLQRALDRSDAQDEDLRSGWASMMHDLKEMTRMAGQLLANTNKWKANTAAQHLDDWFQYFDRDASGGIDVQELQRGLERLGMDSHSHQAKAIVKRYAGKGQIDAKQFSRLVRDVQLLLTFDQDGSGTLDADELLPALRKLGLSHKAIAQVTTIVATWDENGDGQINLLEFVTLVRDLKVFTQFDRDGSGTISAAELRLALRALGTNVDNELAAIILAKYDRDRSGVIELHEFSHLVRDLPALVGPRGAYEDPFAIDFLPSNPMAC